MCEEIAPQLKDAGWTCNRCQADNLALRDKCYRCSGSISDVQLRDLAGIREDLKAEGSTIPQRTAKRGGAKCKREGQSSRPLGSSGGKGGSRGDPVGSTDRAVPESQDGEGE